MMKEYKDNAFVVINELFTTAANYDAIIMGQNVLKHFLDEGCHGIYVTHLRELCDIDERIVGLSAQLDENGKQNFKIQKKSVDYEGCAKNQVEKYGLGYDKLVGRLSHLKQAH
jgi:DNA mismatch repair ATPase MutS